LGVAAAVAGMHPRAAEFADRAAEEYGIEIDVTEFPEGTKTAADAAEAVGCEVGQIASSIVVALANGDAAGDLVVAVTSGANRVDLDAVARHFGAEAADMADAGRINDVVGWSIGGVPPICHDAELPAVVDPSLRSFDTVWAAAGTPTAVFPITPERLRDLAGGEVVDLTE